MSYLSKQYKKARRAISGAATSSGVSFTVPKIPSITDIKNMIAKGPTGGVPKQIADKLYGGSTKAAVENVQRTYKKAEKKVRETLLPSASLPSLPTGILGDDDDDDTTTDNPFRLSGESMYAHLGGGLTTKKKKKSSRQEANLTTQRSSSLLTS